MLSGRVQLGETLFIDRATPNIPVAGDIGQEKPVTYATLAPLSNVGLSEADQRAESRAGETVMALLGGDGWIVPNAVLASSVRIGSYDETTGHNIADVFVEWNADQPHPELYLLGHPVTEPYWIDTVVNGTPQRTLIQAFQRRILTFTPENTAGAAGPISKCRPPLPRLAWVGDND